jgi:serpin B
MFLNTKSVRKKDPKIYRELVQGNTQFALDIYQKLRGNKGNLLCSPYSISTALAMTFAGARGETESQMEQTLHISLDQKHIHPLFASLEGKIAESGKGHVQLEMANALWPRKGYEFLKEYLALVQKNYGVKITPLDFGDEMAARQAINSWVEEKTAHKIKDLIPAGMLDNFTRMVLVNAIYFKGNWVNPFDPKFTRTSSFWTEPNEQVQAPMMNSTHEFRNAEVDGLQMLEMPYSGNDLTMLVLLPREIDGLAKLEDSLTIENLENWISSLQNSEIKVSLPRFEITLPFRLDEVLKSLGMVNAFSKKADFSGMDGSKELYIGAALHKAFIDVNELGTEAAAAAAVIMMTKASMFPPAVFTANHPFLFLIHENSTRSILFMGRLINPS